MWSALILGVTALAASGGDVTPLTDAELKALMPGILVRQPHDWNMPEQFNRDGSYLRYADNLEIEGCYTVSDGKVCVKDEFHPEFSRLIGVDKAGQYYTAKAPLTVIGWWPVFDEKSTLR